MSANNSFTQFSDELAAMVEKAGASVALINARRRLPASGIVYAPDLVLTADHVIEREEDLSVVLGDSQPIPASLAGRDPGRDLALLRLSQSSAVPFTPAEGSPKVGQIAIALARPDAEGIQASLGIVSAVGGPARTGRGAMLEQYLRADIVPYPGFSGGALVDAAGRLLGLNTSGLAMGTLITIPAALAWQAAATLATHGHIRRAYLGVRSQLVTLAPAQVSALGRQQETALLLVGVEADTPASKAGLQAGDILAGLAGQPLADPEALQVALGSQEAGKESSVEILRGEKRMQVKVTFAERS